MHLHVNSTDHMNNAGSIYIYCIDHTHYGTCTAASISCTEVKGTNKIQEWTIFVKQEQMSIPINSCFSTRVDIGS